MADMIGQTDLRTRRHAREVIKAKRAEHDTDEEFVDEYVKGMADRFREIMGMHLEDGTEDPSRWEVVCEVRPARRGIFRRRA